MRKHGIGKSALAHGFVAGRSIDFWLFLIFLSIVFLTGGASRADVKSLLLLRPLAAAACVYGLATLRKEDVAHFKGSFVFAAACMTLVLAQLIPLPPKIWQTLPGREIFADIDALTAPNAWRPIALNPSGAWNSLFALTVPLAAFLLGVRLSRDELFALLPCVLVFGLLSGVMGLGQSIGNPEGPLYFYHVTNHGAAVGLFANRNHQAFFLAILFPMLAAFAATRERGPTYVLTIWGCGLVAGALIPLLLVTGSRTGLVLGGAGILAGMFMLRDASLKLNSASDKRSFQPGRVAAAVVMSALVAISILTSRAEAVRRLLTLDEAEEVRFAIWRPISDMVWKYFPVGSGAGSFAEVYQIDEPYDLLRYSYINHAHNDWLEIAMTMGLPGVLLILISVVAVLRCSLMLREAPKGSQRRCYGQLGLFVIAALALGSLTDYPVRTPIMSVLAVTAFLWLHIGSARQNKQTSGGHDG